MKTLHLTNYWHPKSGGIRTFYTALMEAANDRGHQMRLVVPSGRNAVERVGRHGIIYEIESPPAPFGASYRILYPHRALLPGGRIHAILAQERPDLIEICDKFTLPYLGGLLRVGMVPGIDFRPAVIGLSCERLDRTIETYLPAGSWTKVFSSLYLRWLYFPLCDHHIAVSHYVAEELRAVSGGHKVDRGVWIGQMGADAARFGSIRRDVRARTELLIRLGGDDRTIILVYAGRMAREKNLPLLIETMQILASGEEGQRYRLLMVGDGDERAPLQRQAEYQAPGLVHFFGYIGAELPSLLAACDIFVHPNPAEPFGIGPLEAMAAGLPLAVPASGGVLSYANRDNAWLAPPEPAAFAQLIRDAWRDQAERERRAENARRTAREMAWPRAAARFLDLYPALHSLVLRGTPVQGLEPEFVSTR